MAEDALISVVIPARNAARFVKRALRSAIAQTYQQLEIIVVDDGSTDETVAIVGEFVDTDARIRLISADNIGVSAARNLAIAHARGELIAALDSDDVWHPEKLTKQLAALHAAGPAVGVVYCWSIGIDEDDRVILPSWNDSKAAGNVLRDIVVRGIAGNGSTPLIRKSYIEAVGGYDEGLTLCEDWKFYTALAGVCEFAVVPEYLTGYRLHPESASVSVLRMEKAIADVTAWIVRTWPWLPAEVLLERRYTVDTYLAFLAIREHEYLHALRFLRMALRTRPDKLFTRSYVELFFLLLVHAAGLRCYRWDFWRRPVLDWAAGRGERGQRPIRLDGTPIAASSNSPDSPKLSDGSPT